MYDSVNAYAAAIPRLRRMREIRRFPRHSERGWTVRPPFPAAKLLQKAGKQGGARIF